MALAICAKEIYAQCSGTDPWWYTPATLIQSGFEANTQGSNGTTKVDDLDSFHGQDLSVDPPNDWDALLEDVRIFAGESETEFVGIGYEAWKNPSPPGADSASATIITDPTDGGNKVVQFAVWRVEEVGAYSGAEDGPGRVEFDIYDAPWIPQVWLTYRIRLNPDLVAYTDYPGTYTFFQIHEFGTGSLSRDDTYTFRVSVAMQKVDSGTDKPITFYINGEKYIDPSGPYVSVWIVAYTSYNIPFGTWLSAEVGWSLGDDTSGRFYYAVTPAGGSKEVICDVTNWTYNPDIPGGEPLYALDNWNPMKLYYGHALADWFESQGVDTVKVYYDDFKIDFHWP